MTKPDCPKEERPAPPVDDPFLERLFGVMCEHIPVRPDDSFIDQARRWCETLRYMAGLQPRTGNECLMAADIAMKNQFVLATLAGGRTEAARRRKMRSRAFIASTRDLREAHLQYDLIRGRPLDG